LSGPKPIDLLAYLRDVGGSKDLRVLREGLVTQGYDPDDVDHALALYRIEQKTLQRAQTAPSPMGCTLGGFLLGIPVALLNLWVFADHGWYLILVGECVLGLVLVFAGRIAAQENADGVSLLTSGLGGGLIVGSVLPGALALLVASVCKGAGRL
jgi:hypothetical protein